MMPIDPVTLAKFGHVALRVVTDRALTWATMLITAAMFGYALYLPDPVRFGVAVAFAVLVFWRVTWVEKSKQPPTGDGNG